MAACEKCIGQNCYGSTCNFECREYGSGNDKWCETLVMGGGDAPFDAVKKSKNSTYDYCQFLCQRVEVVNKRMAAAGIEVGDTLTHVNKNFYSDQKSFADAVSCLPIGTELRVIKPDGRAVEVTLK